MTEYSYITPRELQIYSDIYYGNTSKYFNISEFESKRREIDWVSVSLVSNCIDMIVDMIRIGDVKVTFENDEQTEYWNYLVDNTNLPVVLEQWVKDLKIYGDSYIQLAIEDNPDNASEKYELKAYNINPQNVYADFDLLNPQRGAKKYSIVIEKKGKKKNEVLKLIVSFSAGLVEYEAFKTTNQKNWEAINPQEYFEEFFSESLTYLQEGLKFIYETGLEYNLLTHLNNKSEYGEFYGQSDINKQVISKLQVIERMYNLADHATTNNANPKMALSKATAKVLKGVIEEQRGGVNESNTQPVSFTSKVTSSTKQAVSFLFSRIAQIMNQKLVYFEDDGQGETKYIVNPYRLEDLFKLIEKIKAELYNDLYISEILINPEINSGANNLSGIALKRLMTRTLQHIENLKVLIEPKLKQLAFTVLQLAKNSNLPEATYSDVTELPEIQWADIDINTIQDVVEKYKAVIEIKDSQDIRDKAVADILDVDLETVQNWTSPVSLRDTLTQRLNNTNERGNNNQRGADTVS